MKKNIGGIDRAVRVLLGLMLLLCASLGKAPDWSWIGVFPLVTGVIGYTPVYHVVQKIRNL